MTDTNTDHLKPYTNAAGEVVGVIGARAGTDGDPQLYGATYGGLAAIYLDTVRSLRPFGQADAHVLDVLRAVALMASGGVQAQRFRDMIAAALAGSVHVEAAFAALQAARSGQNEPQTAADRFQADLDAEHGPDAPMPPAANLPDTLEPVKRDPVLDVFPRTNPDKALDEERASDVELLRWCLDPAADPWADLLESADGNAERVRRPGVDQEDVQARFDRLHALLDTSRAPDGVTKDEWQAAQRRVLPTVYGDKGAA